MGFLFSILSICALAPQSANAQNSIDRYKDRAEIIEQQVQVSCEAGVGREDPVRTQLAERIMSDDGPAALLLKDIKKSAEKASDTLEHAEQAVAERNAPLVQQKKDEAQKNLDTALAKIHPSGSLRTPASVSDDARDDVRKAYAQYQNAGQDLQSNDSFRKNVKDLQQSKLSEIKILAGLGDRVQSARKKATTCYCTTSNNCKNKEQLHEESDYYSAYISHRDVKARATNPEGAIGTSSSGR